MGSKTFDGVWFEAYSDDHGPPHVHGLYGDAEVIVELVDRTARLSSRSNAILPKNAKQGHVLRILRVAADHAAELAELWRVARG